MSSSAVQHARNAWCLAKASFNAWLDDYAPSMGAALSYYTLFSIAPLLIIVIAVAGLAFGADAVQNHVFGQLRGLIGDEGAIAIQGLIKSASSPGRSVLAVVVGVLTLLVGATTVFSELQDDLDRIWHAPRAIRPSGLWGLLRTRFLSLGIVVGVGFVLLVSLVLSAALAALGEWWSPAFGGWSMALQVMNFLVSLLIVTTLFAMTYKVLPSVKIAWRDVMVGSAVTALLFTIGKLVIGLYIGKSGIVSGFGAAASIVVLLIWVYYSAQIFLLGAEFTYIYAHDFGSLRDVPKVDKRLRMEASPPISPTMAADRTSAGRGADHP